MRYLMRDGAPLSDGQWEKIDAAVVDRARDILVGRRFLDLVGPIGAHVQNVALDAVADVQAATADFWGNAETTPLSIGQRRFIEMATIYSDFIISWRDIENEAGAGIQAADDAAMLAARREDELIFNGDKSLGIDGLLTAKGVNKLPIGDWSKGEVPVADIAKALAILQDKGCAGRRALVVSTDLYAKLHRIQPGTGVMEVDRLKSLVNGGFFHSSRIGPNKAVFLYCDPQNVDLVVGQDLITAYMGNDKMDHVFRVMETVTPRVKRPSAIVVLG